jgi:phospholipid/cholesterol/gamma-HCH transport system ATP-binding protein
MAADVITSSTPNSQLPTANSPLPTPNSTVVELRHVSKRFGRLTVLDDLSLTVERGKCLVVIGPSGTGKSVMLKHIVGLIAPDEGEVWYDGRRIDDLPQRQVMALRTDFGFLFQMGALFDSLTVAENVGFPLVEHSAKSAAEVRAVVESKLAMVGLPGAGGKMPMQMSGGQRKRVALARAIALDPKVILYDEPTTGLDPIRSDVINELIIKLQRELRVTSIVVTHDMQSAMKVADRIVMLTGGRIVFDGTADQIRASDDPIVRRFVVGEASEEELAGLRAPAP